MPRQASRFITRHDYYHRLSFAAMRLIFTLILLMPFRFSCWLMPLIFIFAALRR
jgi:hypothetical protein